MIKATGFVTQPMGTDAFLIYLSQKNEDFLLLFQTYFES